MRSFAALSFALTMTILLAHDAAGQSASGSVTIGGQVSRAVFLDVAPTAQLHGDNFQVTHTQHDAHTVHLSISVAGGEAGLVSIPLQLRSNAGFKLSASAELSNASLSTIRVTDARATGSLVAAEAVNAATDGVHASTPQFPFTRPLLTGPRISLGGTYDTPSNALEVTLLLEVRPHEGHQDSHIELTLTASPDSN